MTDYIEKSEVLAYIVTLQYANQPDERPPVAEDEQLLEWAYQHIKKMTPADVAPVVHGEWRKIDIDTFMCSSCREWLIYTDTTDGKYLLRHNNYCPNCGSRNLPEEK